MNRREAIQAAAAAVAGLGINVKTVDGPADDVLCMVLQHPCHLSDQAVGNINRSLIPLREQIGVPIIFLEEGMKVTVLRKRVDADLGRRVAELEALLQPCEVTASPISAETIQRYHQQGPCWGCWE